MVEKPVARLDPTRGTKGVHSLDRLDTHSLCGRLTVFTPAPEQIDSLMGRARIDLPKIADNDVVRRVVRENPDSFWAIRRKSTQGPSEPRGFAAFLMLNQTGADELIRGELDATDPPHDRLVGQHQKPAAIYVWLVHAKGMLAPALGLVMEKLQAPLYRDVDLIARAVTQEGSQFNDSLGFHRGLWWDGAYYPTIHHYRREASSGEQASPILLSLRAPFDDHRPESPDPERIAVKVVHNMEEFNQAIAIRSAVYFGEQRCPYAEEFDGNDYSATHMLAYLGAEPVGCLRIRYFADFAKLERLAVRREFRERGVGCRLIEAAAEFCRIKGYRELYAHARADLIDFWTGRGFSATEMAASFRFSDVEYTELSRSIVPVGDALSMATDPYILIRPEGQWTRPGVLEESARRSGKDYALVA